MKYQAVVFDLDGTLLDTLTDLWKQRERGLPGIRLCPQDQAPGAPGLGNGLENLLRKSLPQEDENKFQRVFQDFRAYYLKHCNEATQPYDGSRNC